MKQADVDRLWEKYKKEGLLGTEYINEDDLPDVLEEAEQMQWHDMRENPDDLPDNQRIVIVADDDTPSISYPAYLNNHHGWVKLDGEELIFGVIAWRELEKWKEKKE